MLLGAGLDFARPSTTELLPAGCTLLLYTDGLVEHRARSLTNGLERLAELAATLASQPLDELCDTLLHQLATEPGDDICLLALRIPNTRPGHPPVAAQRSRRPVADAAAVTLAVQDAVRLAEQGDQLEQGDQPGQVQNLTGYAPARCAARAQEPPGIR